MANCFRILHLGLELLANETDSGDKNLNHVSGQSGTVTCWRSDISMFLKSSRFIHISMEEIQNIGANPTCFSD